MSEETKKTPQAEEPAVEPNTAEQAAPETAPEQAAAPETNAEAADPKKKDGFFNKKARELEAVKAKLDAAEKNANQAKDQLLRMAAEYENYRKRSTREADQKFNDGVSFAVNQIIIGSARTDRRYAGNNCLSVHLFCISNSGKSHILLIFTLIKFKIMTALLQSLTNADNTAVAENAKHTADKLCFNTVTFDILIVEELNKRLRHSKSYSFHKLCLNFRKFNRSVLSNRKFSRKTQTKSLKTVINSSLSRLIINHAVNKLCHLVSKRLHISFKEEI